MLLYTRFGWYWMVLLQLCVATQSAASYTIPNSQSNGSRHRDQNNNLSSSKSHWRLGILDPLRGEHAFVWYHSHIAAFEGVVPDGRES
jgi:hypothetical protein